VATGLGEMGVADEIIERVLNHAPATVARRHYNRSERFDEMKAALGAWAVRLEKLVTVESCPQPSESVSHRETEAVA
jgi:hypothetical protein